MVVYDMCVQGYNAAYEAKTDLSGRVQVLSRRFVGSDFTSLTTTATDSFKIFKVAKHQMIDRVWTIVTDADDTSILLDIGYTDGTNTDADCWETDVNLNAAGVTTSADDIAFFDDDGYFVTLTFAALSTLDADCEFVIAARVIDLSGVGVTEALTAPV